MHLLRNLLDNEVYDADNRRIEKVDGIVLVMRRGKPPRVSAIELGLPVLGRRISRRLGDWFATLEQRLGVGNGAAVRIDLARIETVGIDVHANIDACHTTVYAWERWIDRILICRIPGSGRGVPEGERK